MLVYCKYFSCEMILICFIEDWKYVVEKGYVLEILFIDMSKVFDLLYLKLLLVKLKVYGLFDFVLRLM